MQRDAADGAIPESGRVNVRLPDIFTGQKSTLRGAWTAANRYVRRAREPVSRFKLFYDTMPAGTKYFILEYYVPWLWHDVELFKQLLPAN